MLLLLEMKRRAAKILFHVGLAIAVVLVAIAGFFFFSRNSAHVAKASYSGYTYRRAITVTSTTSVASGTLSNFPMLVSSTITSWEPTSTGGHVQNLCTAPNGGTEPCDLIFSAAPTCASALNFETEKYVSSTGALVDWVNVPTMQAGAVVYACYGDPSVTTDQSNHAGTWNGNYLGVWHFASPTSTVQGNDSTANSNSATLVSVNPTASEIDGGGDLGSNVGYLTTPAAIGSSFTLSAWANIVNYNASGYGFLFADSSNNLVAYYGYGSIYYAGGSSIPAPSSGANHLISVTRSGGTDSIYVDGVLKGSASDSNSYANLTVGVRWGGAYYQGTADELNVSSVSLSPSWILTEYDDEVSPGTFYDLGVQQGGDLAVLSVATSTSLHYFANVSGTSSAQSIIITNNASSGASSLNWSASSTASWLTFSAPSGTLAAGATTSLALTASPTGLATGTYNATATIQDPSATSSPVSLAVMMNVSSTIIATGTNISSNVYQHWAWNDSIGWINFYSSGNILVTSPSLSGYADSIVGDISLDCHTTRIGNICGTSSYQTLNDGTGNLSGWGWNDAIGWISFNCSNNGGCGTSNYRVYVDSSGNFQGYAWNDLVGWIDFNCDNVVGACSTSNYEVSASWFATSSVGYIDSTTFDTKSTGGAQLNSLLWQGSLPAGTSIGFQFAVSNSSGGPWNFQGPDGTSSSSYAGLPGTPIPLGYSQFSGFRYFRYRTTLTSDITQVYTPVVNKIIVNWSP